MAKIDYDGLAQLGTVQGAGAAAVTAARGYAPIAAPAIPAGGKVDLTGALLGAAVGWVAGRYFGADPIASAVVGAIGGGLLL